MRAFGIGLAAALILAVSGGAAMAAPKDAFSSDQHKQGMKEAPPLVAAGHLPCTVTDAAFLGTGAGPDKVQEKFYEVACQEGMGYVVAAKDKATAPSTIYNCVMMSAPTPDGKPNPAACKLPANANPAAGLTPIMSRSSRPCSVAKARYMGSTSDMSMTQYEVACADGGDYIVQAPSAPTAKVVAIPCIQLPASAGDQCTLTTPAQQASIYQTLITASGKPCTLKDKRYIGSGDSGDFYEVACADGKGYVLETDPAGAFKDAIDCAKAAGIGGGCTLTDARQAETEQDAVYTDLAKKAGFDCAVSKYADFPTADNTTEIVELACSNRPDGGVGFFPNKGAPVVRDCLRAETEGYRCSFSSLDPLYAKLTAQLKARGKSSCAVNGARAYGRTNAGDELVEVACSDGGPGWVLEYGATSTAPTDLLNCAQAAQTGGGGCQLPTNKGH